MSRTLSLIVFILCIFFGGSNFAHAYLETFDDEPAGTSYTTFGWSAEVGTGGMQGAVSSASTFVSSPYSLQKAPVNNSGGIKFDFATSSEGVMQMWIRTGTNANFESSIIIPGASGTDYDEGQLTFSQRSGTDLVICGQNSSETFGSGWTIGTWYDAIIEWRPSTSDGTTEFRCGYRTSGSYVYSAWRGDAQDYAGVSRTKIYANAAYDYLGIDNYFVSEPVPALEDVLFGGHGTTTQIIQLNYPANNMQGATSSVGFSFDYMVGSDIIPSHVGLEIVRYLPNGFTYLPIEEAVVSSGVSTFTGSFEPDFYWAPYDQFFRWRAYLRDENNNMLDASEWRFFTTSTTTPVADPSSSPAWEVWYDYSSSTVTSDTGYINTAYDRCDEFDDSIGNDLFAKPLCRLVVFLFVPENSYTLGGQLLSDAKSRVPFSYVAAVTDTVTAARSEYYTSELTFPDLVINTGTSSAIDIEFAVLSKDNIEAIAGPNTIPQFRIIMEYFIWMLFMMYAFFVAIHEVRRLAK